MRKLFRREKKTDPSPRASGSHAGRASQTSRAQTSVAAALNVPGAGESSETGRGGTTMIIKQRKDLWPSFESGALGEPTPLGDISVFHQDNYASKWARQGFGSWDYFARPYFPHKNPGGVPVEELPVYLYDLQDQRVVRSSEVGPVNFLFISHVWGETKPIDGQPYGVRWPIEIRSPAKLSMILEAARVVIGERYLWMDALCIDPNTDRDNEIRRMGSYLQNASGCLAWLDNAFEDARWNDVLSSLRALNNYYHLDQHGIMAVSVEEFTKGFTIDGDVDAFLMPLQHVLKLEQAPWFKRVWTLQEGVVPENIYFCTPERYMMDARYLWKLVQMIDFANASFVEGIEGALDLNYALQRSETFKMVQLRHFYRNSTLSFWHAAQATRTRQCKVDEDRLVGTFGMLPGRIPNDCTGNTKVAIFQDWYKLTVENGDMTPTMFLGGQSLLPDLEYSMAVMAPQPIMSNETHSLRFVDRGLQMDGVGIQQPLYMLPIQTHGYALLPWRDTFPEISQQDMTIQLGVVRAFGLKKESYDRVLCPATFAILAAIGNMGDDTLLDQLPKDIAFPEFREKVYDNSVRARLVTLEMIWLGQNLDYAMVVIWDSVNLSHLAVLTERVDDATLEDVKLVMPSSYRASPGKGCLVCKYQGDGTYRKIGICIGKSLTATETANILLAR